MNKKKVSLIASIPLLILVVTASALYMANSGITPFSKISTVAFAAGTPDALGNRIYQIVFQQNSTGAWADVGSLNYASYVLNYNLTIPANQHTLVFCQVYLNISLAGDAATAMTRARVYLTISGVVTSASMLVQNAINVGPYWIVGFGYPSITSPPTSTWIPATDTTYTITFQYQAYY